MSIVKFNPMLDSAVPNLFSSINHFSHTANIPTIKTPFHLDLSTHLNLKPRFSELPSLTRAALPLPQAPSTSNLHVAMLNATPDSPRAPLSTKTQGPALTTTNSLTRGLKTENADYANAVWTAEILPAQAEKIGNRVAENGIAGGAIDFASYLGTFASGPVAGWLFNGLGAALKTTKFSSYFGNSAAKVVQTNSPASNTLLRSTLKEVDGQVAAASREVKMWRENLNSVQSRLKELKTKKPTADETAKHFSEIKTLHAQEKLAQANLEKNLEHLASHQESATALRRDLADRYIKRVVELR